MSYPDLCQSRQSRFTPRSNTVARQVTGSGRVRSQKHLGATIYDIELQHPNQIATAIAASEAHFESDKDNDFPVPDQLGKELYQVRYKNAPDSSEYVGPAHRNIKSQFVGRFSGSIDFALTALNPDAANNTYFIAPSVSRDIVLSMSTINTPFVDWTIQPATGVTLIDNGDGTATLRTDAAVMNQSITVTAERYGVSHDITININTDYGYWLFADGGALLWSDGGATKHRTY